MKIAWRDFAEKNAQSIVFGGGPPPGGKLGDPYDVPRKNPLRTLGDLGKTLHNGMGELGRHFGKVNGYDPDISEQVFQVGSSFIPVYGVAEASGRLSDSLLNGNLSEAAEIASTSDAAIEKMVLPTAVRAGLIGYRGANKAYKGIRKWLRGMQAARSRVPALATLP